MTGGLARRAALCAVLLAAATQWACAPQRVQQQPAPRGTATAPSAGSQQPSGPGNPPFYDVLGKRYFVRATAEGYVETGTASWYGRDFHGLRTSNGEVYDMYALTAAHTTLPIPTWVEVTNLQNGKSVIVRINDRGPFAKNRIIDLSYAAAQAIDMVRAGTARVQVRAIGTPGAPLPPADSSQPVVASAAPPARGGGFSIISPAVADDVRPGDVPFRQLFVQVGAFGERGNAERLVARLSGSGFPNAFVVSEGGGRGALHRVRVGPLANDTEFDRVTGRLRALGFGDAHLVVDR